MYMLIFMFFISLIISLILISLSLIFSKKTFFDSEKSSPFECGFDPKNSPRVPFSIRFFLIAIIFLIFDIEISILLPLGIVSNAMHPISWMMVGGVFLVLVTLGLYYEWYDKTLEWIS